MASSNQLLASMASLSLSAATRPSVLSIPRFLAPTLVQMRFKTDRTAAMQKRQRDKEKLKRKRRQARFKEYKYAVPSREEQFSLMDAMRYLRAAEVGRPPASATYELALKLRTPKNSPVIRSRIRLPFPVKNDTKIGVICPPNSTAATEARQLGAVAIGEEEVFDIITGNPANLPFNRLLCHQDSAAKLARAGLGRILGPKGLMPSAKTNTITKNIKTSMQEMVGAEVYRERMGAIRLPIGNIQFTPKMLSENVKTLVQQVRDRIVRMEDRVNKDLIEVVLSSTNGPGFSLNGEFATSDQKVDAVALSTAM